MKRVAGPYKSNTDGIKLEEGSVYRPKDSKKK